MMARGPDSPPFRLDRSAFHMAVDMRLLFAEPTEWFVPWLPRVLPNVVAIARRHPDRTLLTRFIPPQQPEEATGAWRDYYVRWRGMTRDRLDPRLLELVEPLRALVPPANASCANGNKPGLPGATCLTYRRFYPTVGSQRRE